MSPEFFAWMMLFWAVLSALVSCYKNRHFVEGFILGAVLGIFGVVIALCMPAKSDSD